MEKLVLTGGLTKTKTAAGADAEIRVCHGPGGHGLYTLWVYGKGLITSRAKLSTIMNKLNQN